MRYAGGGLTRAPDLPSYSGASLNTDYLVDTMAGPVRGHAAGAGVVAFKGIPYAADPVGALRFLPPQPPPRRDEPFAADAYGPTAPQFDDTGDGALAALLPNVVIPGDAYLNLNVWAPAAGAARPVLVFFHGGAFTSGSGAVPAYDGARFARDGVLLVTFNYRLGADGFLWFGHGTPNLGLLDQVAALAWVRDNIAGFGGDPANVTIFGESAGAMSVCTLLVMPAARGLFRRAIAESGAGHAVIGVDSALLVARRLAAILGVAPTREAVARVPMALLLAAQAQLAGEVVARPKTKLWGEVARNYMPFEPVVDGVVLPGRPIDLIDAGAAAGVEILLGYNREEARLFLAPTGAINQLPFFAPYLVAWMYRLPVFKAVRLYRAARPGAGAGDVVAAIMTDWTYRVPALRIAEAHAGTYIYEFAWPSPACDGTLGACHGAEIAFVFDRLDDPGFAAMLGPRPPQALADAMHRAWVDFATSGDPGWPAYSSERRIGMRYDAESGTEVDTRADERRLWDGRR